MMLACLRLKSGLRGLIRWPRRQTPVFLTSPKRTSKADPVANLAAWYEPASVAGDFEQGDIFTNATIPNISAVDLSRIQEIPTRRGSFIVLTQSCDVPKAATIL